MNKDVELEEKMNYFEQYQSEIIKTCKEYASKDVFQCLHDDGKITSQTYDKLYQQILDFKNIMDKAHLEKGDRVIILDTYGPAVLRTFISASYWNLTVALIDINLPQQELDYFVDYLDARAIFTSEKYISKINEDARKRMPVLDQSKEDASYPDISGFSHELPLKKTIDPNFEAAAIILSSGTTSNMKPILITHRSLMLCAEVIEKISKIPMDKTYLLLFPLFHISGLASAVATFFYGFTMQMVEQFSPAVLQEALQTFNPYLFGMVPKVFELMIQKMHQEIETKGKLVKTYYKIADSISGFFLKQLHIRCVGRLLMKPFAKALFGKNIRYLCVGAAPCVPEVAETIMKMGIVWDYVYASTECGLPITGVGCKEYSGNAYVGNVFSNDYANIMIKNPDLEGVGEIYVKTDFIMKGYFRDSELTKNSFEDGYFKTGDLGRIDKDGNLYIVGRQKETIILQTGKKVSPYDLEDVLNAKLESNCELAVCGVLNEKDGYDLIHVFVKDMNYSDEKKGELQNQILEIGRKEAAMYPIYKIHFVQDIPKTIIGKVKRYILKGMLDPNEVVIENKEKEPQHIQYTGDLTIDILAIMQKFAQKEESCTLDDYWQEIMPMDSLKVFELCTEIELQTGAHISAEILEQDTISDVIEYIKKIRK